MELYFSKQFIIFLYSLLTGSIINIVYDVFKIMRKTFKHGFLAVFIQDITFSFISLFISIAFISVFNYGQIRGYLIFGLVSGFVITHFTIGNLIVIVLSRIFNLIFAPFRYIYNKFKLFLKKLFIFTEKRFIIIKEYFTKRKEGAKTGGKSFIKKNKHICKNSFRNRYRLPALCTNRPSGKNKRKTIKH